MLHHVIETQSSRFNFNVKRNLQNVRVSALSRNVESEFAIEVQEDSDRVEGWIIVEKHFV